MSCCCGCGLALAMAEAEEKIRREACDGHASESPAGDIETPAVPAPSSGRGWEALKASLRQLMGADRNRTIPHIASAA